jgi:hypothetical protein
LHLDNTGAMMSILRNFYIYIFILIFIIHFQTSFAQRFNCEVQVEIPRLREQPEVKETLIELNEKLNDYINNTVWNEENQDIVLNCKVQLIIETFTDKVSERVFRSQFLINSPSGENFYDKACEFTYVPGQAFESFRTSFDPLLDLVDYYIFLVIGGELDTYDLFAGSPFYDKAQDLANQGQLSNYSVGWQRRLDEVILITDGDHVPLREAKYYYYEGLYFIEREPNADYAQKFAAAVIERLEKVYNKKPNSRVLKRFLDAHYQEICKLFQFDDGRVNIEKMLTIDPLHRDTYRACGGGD